MTTSKSERLGALAMAVLVAACGGDAGTAGGDDSSDWGADAGDSIPECFSASECPVGWTCSEFGYCVPPPAGDAGVPPPPEIEYEFGPPVSSLRFVWVAMTDQDAVAKIDGATLEVTS